MRGGKQICRCATLHNGSALHHKQIIAESANSAILDSLIVDIYRNNEYRKLADGENASEEEIAYKDFTLSVKKAGTSGNTIDPLKTSVRLWMTDDYKIKAVISDTIKADKPAATGNTVKMPDSGANPSASAPITPASNAKNK